MAPPLLHSYLSRSFWFPAPLSHPHSNAAPPTNANHAHNRGQGELEEGEPTGRFIVLQQRGRIRRRSGRGFSTHKDLRGGSDRAAQVSEIKMVDVESSFAVGALNARVLVLGDAGVGKTSLVHRVCTGDILARSRWTVGCDVSAMAHRSPSSSRRVATVDFWDVGGSATYAAGRPLFLRALLAPSAADADVAQPLDAVLLVCDRTNPKSYHNLRRWRSEVASIAPGAAPGGADAVPWLIVFNKSEGSSTSALPDARRDHGIDAVAASATDATLPIPARFGTFLDAALAARSARLRGGHGRSAWRPGSPLQQRRRPHLTN